VNVLRERARLPCACAFARSPARVFASSCRPAKKERPISTLKGRFKHAKGPLNTVLGAIPHAGAPPPSCWNPQRPLEALRLHGVRPRLSGQRSIQVVPADELRRAMRSPGSPRDCALPVEQSNLGSPTRGLEPVSRSIFSHPASFVAVAGTALCEALRGTELALWPACSVDVCFSPRHLPLR
jgi:hypothetical protein